MAEQEEISDPDRESMVHEISDNITAEEHSSSSASSNSDSEEKIARSPPLIKAKTDPFLYRGKAENKAFGGAADLFLWRDKSISATALGIATAIWFFFSVLDYYLITLVCHISIFALSMLFLWSNVTIIINKRPSHIPEVRLPQEPFIEFASTLCSEINNALAAIRETASVRDLKKFLEVIGVLWIISIVGSFCNFVTLVYILFVFLHTVPVLYEMYEDKVEALAEKAMMTIKKQYAAFDRGGFSVRRTGATAPPKNLKKKFSDGCVETFAKSATVVEKTVAIWRPRPPKKI
ncbi:reticulon-like protein B5 isoform X2 [Primulina eburnea]|uniref:reticulon-like protein B5 isoform X2 n=1 Tax=Primulina eburnea TaxID=1245227 RepID=UPI003C6BEFFD